MNINTIIYFFFLSNHLKARFKKQYATSSTLLTNLLWPPTIWELASIPGLRSEEAMQSCRKECLHIDW